MKQSSSDTKEKSKHWKLQYKMPHKYITRWLKNNKNPYKDNFQMTNHFRNVFVSQRQVCWARWKYHRYKLTTKTEQIPQSWAQGYFV